MSTSTEISRLTSARNLIRDKLIELGLANSNTKLDALASAVDGIVNQGSISATVIEGATYTIPAGYHNGSGTVSGIAGGGNYSLQSKTKTPTKNQQSVTPDNGYYGLSDVTIEPIPEAYQNVSAVTASAPDVLTNKVIVDSTGANIAGTMINNGAVNKTLDATSNNQTYTVPTGYHNGSGQVKIVLETKTATPSTAVQSITPTSGKVLSKVTVEAIPSAFQNVTNVNATASEVLSGKIIVVSSGAEVEGTMTNNGAISKTLDATTNNQSYTVPTGFHNGAGAVQIVLEQKSATPSIVAQNITPTAGKVLSKVTVNAIPSAYQDVTSVTASAADVLTGKTIVSASGSVVDGAMTDNGSVAITLDATSGKQSYTVAKGYHSGSGTVSITLEQKSATPSTAVQSIIPTNGKVLSKVTVNAIPSQFGDVSTDNAVASYLLAGYKAHTKSGGAAVQITGSMPNNGAINASIDGLTTLSYAVPAGYTTGGYVTLTSDIENALAAI